MASKVLVLNSGSSSLKFKLFENARETLRAVVSGVVERIGDPKSTVGFQLGSAASLSGIQVPLAHTYARGPAHKQQDQKRRERSPEPHSCWNKGVSRPDSCILPADLSSYSGPRSQRQDLHARACTQPHSRSGCGSEVPAQLIFQLSAQGGVCCGTPSRAWGVSRRAPDRDSQGDPGACQHRNHALTAAGVGSLSGLGCCAAAGPMQTG